MKAVICANTTWNLVNFRSKLITALIANGHQVVAVAPSDRYAAQLQRLGCDFVDLTMDNQGTHPGRDALLLWRFWKIFRRVEPDVYLGYTAKPNIYGSLAARSLGISVINNIAGLGSAFIRSGWLASLVTGLYRVAIKRSFKVFFQNADDQSLFIRMGLVPPGKCELLPGSGVDLDHFKVLPRQNATVDGTFRFVLVARLLRDKGIQEYVDAAKILKPRWPQAEFCLLGFVDAKNPTAISNAEVDKWVKQGYVSYLGVSDDVRVQVGCADCVVLPSYREGTPRSLLEAAAMGRPIITTDAVGCREVVDDGINGYLCKVRDAQDLARKMESMLQLTPEQRSDMGLRGRAKMEAQFDEQIVIRKYLSALSELAARSSKA